MNKQPIQFGRYQLQERLAVGGMAELYRAILTGPSGFSKPVVIKKIIGDLARRSQFRKMFEHEGRIMAALSHRNLVQVFELGEVDSELFLCMEYVSGCDLAEVLREHRLRKRFMSPALTAWLGREICQGLEFVHNLTDEAGRPLAIVHRDVNPHNILLSEHGDVKLADFGIAKSMIREVRTMIGQVKGKLQYLAPEQANAETVGPAADIYAVGLILFEMLTAQRYIQGTGQTDWLENASNPTWRSISAINADVPELLENIVQRALRKEPEKRFGTARAMAQVLSQVIEAANRAPSAYDVARLVTSVRGLDCEEHSSVTMPVNNPMLKIDADEWDKNLPSPPTMTKDDREAQPENPLTISLISNTANKNEQMRQWALVGLASLALFFILAVGYPDLFQGSEVRRQPEPKAKIKNKTKAKGPLKNEPAARNAPAIDHNKSKSNPKPSATPKPNVYIPNPSPNLTRKTPLWVRPNRPCPNSSLTSIINKSD